MKKQNGNYVRDNNMKKNIIKRINENLKNKRCNKTIDIKEEKNSNKKINISPNNTINFNLKTNIRKELINLNTYNINEVNNNYNLQKIRNNYLQKKEIYFCSTSKSFTNMEISFKNNNIFKTEYINLKNNNSINFKKNESFIEEIGRKLYINNSEKKSKSNINKNKNKIYIKNFCKNYSTINKKNRNYKFSERNSSANNSFYKNRNLSNLELSRLDRKHKYIKYINKINNTYTFNALNKYLGDAYKRININNNKTINAFERNKNILNSPSYIYKKKHFSSKSQENIHTNADKYNNILKKNNNPNLNAKLYYYVKKLKEIIKIQKWWKEKLFHVYIENKIIYIQKKYKTYLNNKRNKNKNLLFYIKNINQIILIQRKVKIFLLNKKQVNQRLLFNFNKDDSYVKDIPRLIPFKLDNFDINNFTESYVDTQPDRHYSTIKNCERNNNSLKHLKNKNIYIDKNINIANRLNKTISHFYFSSYNTLNENKNNLTIQKNVSNFYIKSNITNKADQEKIIEKEIQQRINEFKTNYLNKIKDTYKCVGNISIEINNNKFNEHLFLIPINRNCFIEKKFKAKINNKIYKKIYHKSNKYSYFSKLRVNKYSIIKKIKLIQKSIKSFLNKRKNNYIKKEKLLNCFITKIKKINLSGNLNANQIESFSFKGSNFLDISNKDKNNEKDIINLKTGKNFCSTNTNVNLFSFDINKNENEIINYNNSELFYKEKIKKLFNRYLDFIVISYLKIINKYLIINKLIIIIKRNIITSYKYALNSLKIFLLNKNENVLDYDEDNKINNINCIKNNNLLIPLFENKNILFEDREELSSYIYNYFYNEKKFTNINIKLIKERLKKCPLHTNTQNDLMQYMHNLYMDIKSNQICNICFCKFGEKFEDNCPCHKNNKNSKAKTGISIYRQRMNKIIQDINKKRLNNEKININTIKNNDENENKENINQVYNFKVINYINRINFQNQNKKDNNAMINRYDSDSIHSRSRSKSK